MDMPSLVLGIDFILLNYKNDKKESFSDYIIRYLESNFLFLNIDTTTTFLEKDILTGH